MAAITGIPAFFTPNPFAFLGSRCRWGRRGGLLPVTLPSARCRSWSISSASTTVPMPPRRRRPMSRPGDALFRHRRRDADARHVGLALPPGLPGGGAHRRRVLLGRRHRPTPPLSRRCSTTSRARTLPSSWCICGTHGPGSRNRSEVARQKDIQHASRSSTHIARQRQFHRLRHVISRLAVLVPVGSSDAPEVEELAGYGCVTMMHVVPVSRASTTRTTPPARGRRFQPDRHPQALEIVGYRDTLATLKQRGLRRADPDPLEGHPVRGDRRRGVL